jgi:hypothetical protein
VRQSKDEETCDDVITTTKIESVISEERTENLTADDPIIKK